MRYDRRLSESAEALSTSTPEPEPVSWCKVDCLCTVEAHVESPVIGIGKGDHKLPLMLSGAVHWDTILVQDPGRQEGRQVEQQVWLALKVPREGFSEGLLEEMPC